MSNVGRNMKRLRESAGARQEDIARVAQEHGLDWGRSTVAMLEAGKYELKAAELILLPTVLARAGVADLPLWALLLSDDDQLRVTDRYSIDRDNLVKLLGRGAKPSNVRWIAGGHTIVSIDAETGVIGVMRGTGETEAKAAKRLSERLSQEVTAHDVAVAAQELWQRSLTDERDARVEAADTGASRRTLQALRAHETRRLLDELETALKES